MPVIDEFITSGLSSREISLGLLIHAAVGNRGAWQAMHKTLGIFLIGLIEHFGPLFASVFRQPIVNFVRR